MPAVAFVSVIALFRATLSSPDPLFAPDVAKAAPHPVAGVWAVLPPDCAPPTGLDLAAWPRCATPLGFLDDEVAALRRPPKGSADTGLTAVAKTKYVLVPGDPAIVELRVETLLSRTTLYIAVQPDALDDEKGFEAATGWPVACPAGPVAGVVADQGRCSASTPEAVRAAAEVRPDPSKLYRLVRIPPADAPLAAPADGAAPQTPAPASSPPPAPSGPVTGAPASPGAAPRAPQSPLPAQAPPTSASM
jgi:hypothetical protein